MRPPLRLDIGWGDLAFASVFGLAASDRIARLLRVEARFGENSFACLSVRSGLDNYLEALALPAGSEILVTAFTIPDMVEVIEAHGLRAVPVDIELDTLAPSVEELERARTDQTRALLVAHLFGSRIDLEPILEFTRRHGLKLLEDGAQVFGTEHYRGHPEADVAMFSFGTIKTATALGGALLKVRDPETLEAMKALREAQPLWPRSAFLRKVGRATVMKFLSYELPYAAAVGLCERAGVDHEEKLHRSARGFHGDLLPSIRHRPNAALLALLDWRLQTYPDYRIEHRSRAVHDVLAKLPESVRAVGLAAPAHTHWVFAVSCDEPGQLIEHLRNHEFDATGAATVTAIEKDGYPVPNCEHLRDTLVYVPAGPELDAHAQARLEAAFSSFELENSMSVQSA